MISTIWSVNFQIVLAFYMNLSSFCLLSRSFHKRRAIARAEVFRCVINRTRKWNFLAVRFSHIIARAWSRYVALLYALKAASY